MYVITKKTKKISEKCRLCPPTLVAMVTQGLLMQTFIILNIPVEYSREKSEKISAEFRANAFLRYFTA